MAQLLKLKRSSVSGKVPTTAQLSAGEIAINTVDGKLFFERDDSTIQSFFTTNALITGSLQQSGSDSYFLSNVGIGTTAPAYKLDIDETTSGNLIVSRFKHNQSGVVSAIQLENRAGAVNSAFDINWGLNASGNQGTIGVVRTNLPAVGGSEMYFKTSYGEVMRLDGSGNVGIGTTSPTRKLTVMTSPQSVMTAGAASGHFLLTNTGGSSGLYGLYGGVTTDGDGWFQVARNDSATYYNLLLQATGGNVGIGTTGPQAKLHIAESTLAVLKVQETSGNTGAAAGALFKTSPNTGDSYFKGGILYEDTGNANVIGKLHLVNRVSADTTNAGVGDAKLTIDTTGNVGIGTTSPSALLHVYSTGNGEVEVQRASGALINLQAQASLGIIGTDSNHPLYLKSNAGTRVQISTAGAIRFNSYGSGTNTGTTTYRLAVDSSGNVIEEPLGAGAVDGAGSANAVTFWTDSDTISGSQDFTWDGTTLSINGVLEANEKSFVIEHPTQPGKKLVYGVLEGPEHAVYYRGKINGEVIELPEEWTGLVHEDSITVQLTPIGRHQNLYVVDVRDNRVFIKNGDLLTSKINAFYYIQGTRKDIKPLQTLRDK